MDRELARVLAGMDAGKYADLIAEVEAEHAARRSRVSDSAAELYAESQDDGMRIPDARRPEDKRGGDGWRQLPKPWRPNPSKETGAGRLPNGISEHIVAALLAKANRNQ